jgi:hypothetical protein
MIFLEDLFLLLRAIHLPLEGLSYIFDEISDKIYSLVIRYDQKWIIIDEYGIDGKI